MLLQKNNTPTFLFKQYDKVYNFYFLSIHILILPLLMVVNQDIPRMRCDNNLPTVVGMFTPSEFQQLINKVYKPLLKPYW